MGDEYMDAQDSIMSEMQNRSNEMIEPSGDGAVEMMGFEEGGYDDDDGNFRGNRGRGGFRRGGGGNRGPPPAWMNGPPPMRFRGRGYGPGGPPLPRRGFFRGRGGPRFPTNNPSYDNNWGPMGPPPPGMMGGPPPFGPPPGMMPPGGPMGPPPNMMGQPPPYGGPPGMPPPNMPAPELWVETLAESGKSYYYHARTRETTWIRPQESPTVKVVTQAEIENMVSSGQITAIGGLPITTQINNNMGNNMGGNLSGNMSGNMGGNMSGNMGVMPNGMPPAHTPFLSQAAIWNKDQPLNVPLQQDNIEDLTALTDDMPPGEAPVQQPNGNMVTNFPPPGMGPGGYPGGFPGGWGGWGGWAPPMGQPPPNMQPAPAGAVGQLPPGAVNQLPPNALNQLPPNAVNQLPPNAVNQLPPVGQMPPMGQLPPGVVNNLPPTTVGQLPPAVGQMAPMSMTPAVPEQGVTELPEQQPVKKEPTVIPPSLIARAAEWTTHRAPDGRAYYYHAARQESVWEKPQPMKELDELKAKLAVEKAIVVKIDSQGDKNSDSKIEVIDVDLHAEAVAEVDRERERVVERERAREQEAERERVRLEKEKAEKAEKEKAEKAEKEKAEKEKADKEKAKQDKSRPISSTPISGTPWCVVWTGDGRVFFYNPTAHSSVWERPAQLVGRADVDKATAMPPSALLQLQRKETAAAAALAAVAAAAAAKAKLSNGELKRAADTDSDDSGEPLKKKKPDGLNKKVGIELGKEAAVEAEMRAARERAVVPHEQRLRAFLRMLHEKDVSAFSAWEKELHKIVFDPRYLMLDAKERRQVFDQYVRDRAEEERKEMKNRLQLKKAAYRALMEEAKLHSKSTFNDFSTKHGRDDRFKAVEKPRDRTVFFNEYITDLRKRDKDDKERKREQAKTDFIALLKEKAVDRHSRWAETKKKVDAEPRYKAVESSTMREDYFREFCKQLKEERKKEKDGKEKEKDRERVNKKEKKEKERDKEKDKERDKDGKKKKGEPSQKEPAAPEATEETEEAEPEEVNAEEQEAAREREARAQASIKEREREVQRALATSLRDRDKEREYHKRDEAVQHFNALLADLVRNPELSWRDAKKQLRKDHRYSLAELLTKDDKERLFGQHTSNLASKRRDKLRALLTELSVSCTAHWKEVKTQLEQNPAAPAYSSASQMEREFRDYQRDKQSAAKTAMRQLLLETRSITHKSHAAVKENPAALQHIHQTLRHDARYLALEHIPAERQAMITSYLEELDKKGPPPPPTATEPSRRAKQ